MKTNIFKPILKNNKKSYYFIFSDNQELINSANNYEDNVITTVISNKEYDKDIHSLNIDYLSVDFVSDYSFLNNFNVKVLIDKKNDNSELYLIKGFFDIITKYNLNNLFVYCLIDDELINIYDKYTQDSLGKITFFNPDKMVAFDFLDRYPVTKYLSSKHFDYNKGLLNANVSFNYLFIGFDNISKEIFKNSLASNQVISDINKKITSNNINYYILSDSDLDYEINNHLFFAISKVKEARSKPNNYLAVIDSLFNINVEKVQYNSLELLNKIKKIITNNSTSYNYLIINIGSDTINIDLGNIIKNYLIDHQLNDVCKLFTYVRSDIIHSTYPKDKYLKLFGSSRVLSNFDNIVNNKYLNIAIKKYCCHYIDKRIKDKSDLSRIDELTKDAMISYYHEPRIKRDSEVSSILSLRTKLNLLGYDYDLQRENNISEYNYFSKVYEDNNLIEYKKDLYYGKGIVNYPLFINKHLENNPRNNLATLEHFRWCSFMIANGYYPPNLDQIEYGLDFTANFNNGKDYESHIHSSIASYAGLKQLAIILANRDVKMKENKEPKEELLKKYDFLKKDFELLDNIDYLLSDKNFRSNYIVITKKEEDVFKPIDKIVKKKEEKKQENKPIKVDDNKPIKEKKEKENKPEVKKDKKPLEEKPKEEKVTEKKEPVKQEIKANQKPVKEEPKKENNIKQEQNKGNDNKEEVKSTENDESKKVDKKKKKKYYYHKKNNNPKKSAN